MKTSKLYQSLLIGCGNIGAGYDLNNEYVQTHLKAYLTSNLFNVSIFDINETYAKSIAQKYNVNQITDLNNVDFSLFDSISIATPTETHFTYLKKALIAQVKVIICEKPISLDKEELHQLNELYIKGASKIFVNYIRRFNPCFIELKELINTKLVADNLQSVQIKYRKGFLNNCSHAIDLFEFLFHKKINFSSVQKSTFNYDFFENDPTFSFVLNDNEIEYSIIGLKNINFIVFEIEFNFKNFRVKILDSGNEIIVEKINALQSECEIIFSQKKCLFNYMTPVMEQVIECLEGKNIIDNFHESIDLNLRLIDVIKKK
jgi:hypothetical protein